MLSKETFKNLVEGQSFSFVIMSGEPNVLTPGILSGTDKLTEVLSLWGFPVQHKVVGKYGGYVEQSLMVPLMDGNLAHRLMQLFGQESYIVVNPDASWPHAQVELHFATGEQENTVIKANGITWFDSEPDDNYTKYVTADGRPVWFTFDFQF